MEVVFLQALQCESGAAEKKHSGCFLRDLRNFYEHISREKIWERGRERERERERERNLNAAILAISLNQYGTRRFLGLGELAVDCGFTMRGISAGCSWATLWVHIYTLDPLMVWQDRCPQVSLNIFIDDLLGGRLRRRNIRWWAGLRAERPSCTA